MYPVSEAYKKAMKAEAQTFEIRGMVGTAEFNNGNILDGSFTISNQCCDSTKMELGSVYIGELRCTFRNLPIPRNSWSGKEIRPVFRLLTEDGWEEIPLGVFTVSSANHKEAGMEVIAYDNMAKLDKNASFDVSSGDAYTFLTTISEACGIPFGMTKNEVGLLPNGKRTLGLYADNDIKTWRNMLSDLAAALGSFATVNREGALVLRMYGGEPVDDLDDHHRFSGGSFSDFSTRYSGLYVTDRDSSTTKYYGDGSEGLTMNVGANPFLQYGLSTTVDKMRQEVCDALLAIDYAPFKVSAIGNPAYDLGDIFTFSGGIADEGKRYCLMKYSFAFDGEYRMEGIGEDPALASGNSKVDKNIIGLVDGAKEASAVYFYSYKNAEEVRIADGEQKQIIFVKFAAKTDTHVVFQAEVCLLVETTEDDGCFDAVARATYFINGEEVPDVHPAETWQDGEHILHLIYDVSATADEQINTFSVFLNMDGGSAVIPAGNSRGVIFGQGLAANGGTWDGEIRAADEVEAVRLTGIFGYRFTDTGDASFNEKEDMGISDGIADFSLAGVFSFGFTDSALIPVFYTRLDANEGEWEYSASEIEVKDSKFQLKSGVQSAYLYTDDIATDRISRIFSYNSGALYAVSFDGGEEWLKYEDGWTSSGVSGMDGAALSAITEKEWMEELAGTVMIRVQLTTGNTLTDIEIYGG